MKTMSNHQRLDERTPPESHRAAWARQPGQPLHRARITDISRSGVGIVLRDEDPPTTGEAIRIVSNNHDHPRRARVVRASKSPTGYTALGCRWISSEERATRHPGRQRPRRYACH